RRPLEQPAQRSPMVDGELQRAGAGNGGPQGAVVAAPAALAGAGAGEGVERLGKGRSGEGDAACRRPEAVAARGEEIGGEGRARHDGGVAVERAPVTPRDERRLRRAGWLAHHVTVGGLEG